MSLPLTQLRPYLGYEFKRIDLLEMALTHRSVSGNNNERLEFLGDSIVNFIMAEALFQKFPGASEGQLTRLRTRLVCGETLAEVSIELTLDKFLRLGGSELKNGGGRRPSILADALEAVIAALYLDAGMSVCQQRVEKWFTSRLNNISLKNVRKDPKTKLQEYLQSKRMPLPQYEIVQTEGEAHEQIFLVRCTLVSLAKVSESKGLSRRKAEQGAATLMLEQLHVCF